MGPAALYKTSLFVFFWGFFFLLAGLPDIGLSPWTGRMGTDMILPINCFRL